MIPSEEQPVHVRRFGDKTGEIRLGWFGHVHKRHSEDVGARRPRVELAGRRFTAKRRFMDVCGGGAGGVRMQRTWRLMTD